MLSVDPVKDLNVKVWGNTGKETVTSGIKNTAVGFGADYKISGFHFAAEYGQNNQKNSVLATATKSRDYYLHGSYAIPQTAVQLVARYDNFDDDTKTAVAGNKAQKITTVGLNWDFEKDARLQIMQELKSEKPTSVKNNDTMIQLSVRF